MLGAPGGRGRRDARGDTLGAYGPREGAYTAPMPIRLALVNDYEVVVRGLSGMLAPYSDELEIVELDTRKPVAEPVDIALYDTFAQAQGSHAALGLIGNPLVGRVVVYTWNLDRQLADGALSHGVAGYVSKALPAEELVAALRAVHAGERITSADPGVLVEAQGDWPGRDDGLTAREAEVIALITQGLSNAEIADMASLSINSVKTYIRTAYRKMGVSSRTNAVLWGIHHGFTPDRVRLRPPETSPR